MSPAPLLERRAILADAAKYDASWMNLIMFLIIFSLACEGLASARQMGRGLSMSPSSAVR